MITFNTHFKVELTSLDIEWEKKEELKITSWSGVYITGKWCILLSLGKLENDRVVRG